VAGHSAAKLLRTQLDLALFPVCAAAHLERQRRSLALFPKPNVPASGFGRQVTLRDDVVSRAVQFLREPPHQKFAFNFPIVSRLVVHLPRGEILNAMDLLSRLSRGKPSSSISTEGLRITLKKHRKIPRMRRGSKTAA